MSKSENTIPVKRLIQKKNQKAYVGTVYVSPEKFIELKTKNSKTSKEEHIDENGNYTESRKREHVKIINKYVESCPKPPVGEDPKKVIVNNQVLNENLYSNFKNKANDTSAKYLAPAIINKGEEIEELTLCDEEIAFENIEKAFDLELVDSELYTQALTKIKEFRENIEKASKQEYSDFIILNERGNKILLLRRGNVNKLEPNKFCLPGGHVDEGENIEAAAYRELKEETGLEVTPIDGYYIDSFKNTDGSTSHYFCTHVSEKRPLMLETSEHFGYEWVLLDKIVDYDLIFDLEERISNMVLPKLEIKKSNPFMQFVNKIADNVVKVFSKPKKEDGEFEKVLESQNDNFDEGEMTTEEYFKWLSKDSEEIKKSTYFDYKNKFEKAVYADNAKNRKLKRVGQQYGSNKKEGVDKNTKEEGKEVVGKYSPEQLQQKAKETPDYYLEQAAKNAKDPLMQEVAKKELEKRSGSSENPEGQKENKEMEKPTISKEEQELSKDDGNILEEEKKALNGYTKSDYREINRYVRKGRKPPNEELEDYIKSVSSGLNKLDKHEGTVYRAESPIKELSEYLEDFQKGNEIQFSSFTSTTKEKSVIDNFGGGELTYQIKSKNGRSIEDYSDAPKEKEVLFDVETNFKVTKVKQNKLKNGMLIGIEVFLEEI
ncbi:NUDIX domain-containing protein [Lutibacter sp.]|uniref:NUDIX domain-containing protein n=1 Tax=Lutibacter sp. TaxID=1925666 RepID=UPI0034A01976